MDANDPEFYKERRHGTGTPREGDVRDAYTRDRARILHSAAFRRLQGKTQVMGVGEGDFHRTRLTHSIECAQIGNGLLETLIKENRCPPEFQKWLPSRDLVEAACFAHDIGHPPFGHGGEKALHREMAACGGFEGNGQTLRILTRLEKYKAKHIGIDPTRRLILAILKYPVPYGAFSPARYQIALPKCYFDSEIDVVNWALEGISQSDRTVLSKRSDKDKPINRTFDCSLMEIADDVAYGIHDIEDIVARKLIERGEIEREIQRAFKAIGGTIGFGNKSSTADEIVAGLFKDSFERKQTTSLLVNIFISAIQIQKNDEFQHPLLAYKANLPPMHRALLSDLKDLALKLVVSKAQVQQLEQRGQRVVTQLFSTLVADPENLVPKSSWGDTDETSCNMRRICDYIAGMTDTYAEKVYRRLFIPGWGSSTDEL